MGPKLKALSSIGNWQLTKTIGKGSTGKVKLAINHITGEKRACKVILATNSEPLVLILNNSQHIGPTSSIRDIPGSNTEVVDHGKEFRIIREAAIMLLLDHPHIVILHEIHLIDTYFYLFFELVNGGQMLDFIISHGKLKEKIARKYLRQIVSAVDYCHCNSIVHRDLKIENILIDHQGSIKLIDFGLSNLYSPFSQLSTFCGSLYFAAPELLAAKSYVGPEGIILYVLVCGHVPFDDNNMTSLHAKIRSGVLEYPSYLSSGTFIPMIRLECKLLISMMLQPNPQQRCSMEDIKWSSWIIKGFDGPPDNYLPSRMPLDLPLNPEVIKRMKGFGFGSDSEIAMDIENSLKNLYLKTPLEALKSNNSFFGSFSSQKFDLKGVGRALIHSQKNERGRFLTPENSIISIYYLVSEKLARDHGKLINANPQSAVELPSANIPTKSEILEDDDINNGVIRSASLDEIRSLRMADYARSPDEYRMLDEENGCSDEEVPAIFSVPSSPLYDRQDSDAIEESRRSRHRKVRPRAASMGEIPPSLKIVTDLKALKDFMGNTKRKKIRLLQPSKKSLNELDAIQSPHDDVDTENESSLSTPRKQLASNIVSAVKKRFTNFGGKSRGFHSDTTADSFAQPPVSVSAPVSPVKDRESLTINSDVDGAAAPSIKFSLPILHIPRESKPKNFSLTRPRVRGALDTRSKSTKRNSRVKFIRNTSGTEISVDGTDDTHARRRIKKDDARGKDQVDSIVKSVFLKGLFSVATSSTKRTSSIRLELLRAFQVLGIEFKESIGVFECRFDDNPMIVDDKRPEIACSGGWEEGVFEVFIVKIVGLVYGVRFRRISGNIWQYKKLCSKILEELKL